MAGTLAASAYSEERLAAADDVRSAWLDEHRNDTPDETAGERPCGAPRIGVDVYRRVRTRLIDLGYGGDIAWAEAVKPPRTPEALALEHAWVVVNSGMKNTVAQRIWSRLRPAIEAGLPAATAFGHAGKTGAIDLVWRERERLLAEFRAAADKVAWCETLPWIGEITRYHLAKNLGADVAKPDRWLVRLARASGESVEALCGRLAKASGDRVATVDYVLWRACERGALRVTDDGRVHETCGWEVLR